VSFGRTMIRALELQWLAKTHISLNSEEIKPIALTVIELRLSERISKGSESVMQSVENLTK